MADCCSPTFLFVLIRSVHFAACLLLLAIWAFDRLVLPALITSAPDELIKRWQTQETLWTLLLLPLIAISAAAWFMQLCVNMSGLSLSEAMQPDTVQAVWGQTQFGRLWQVRTVIWVCAVVVALSLCVRLPRRARAVAVWIMLALSASLSGSLAWGGHGQDGGGWHLIADAVHLVIAGLWPMGLAPFALLLLKMRKIQTPRQESGIAEITFRFSTIALISVGLLATTGVINGLYMVGSFANLIGTGYGKVLILKVSVFLLILVFAAVNLLRLKPMLVASASVAASHGAAKTLQRNVIAELSLGVIVLIVTAALGLMAPGHG